ncbi:maleylpyruvate isomerase family mycothiol-dependent enzyme [Streptomyces albireticuli]|uniref:Mycothiol maleylpyruvate isomerase n=1 Tax=Streptomyces albireticuli TaxID=1940 RepID=A0A2A2DFY8_9ACTN|nr:maleylpyruvate isomerase family mycothiol-dependent enzyme [Streptomyces albireticuli]MCD9142262.1 maleylpyruvate isomerase family mycothiol-dependent enzyme [Streptomyces albireticuli]MCD9162484.1 maleylpyruvate isomerase family mycothiol-dependent enzyme [Streptomyces albireticuli]MCD9190436.1 maleylpyruvate isomerase family mycothiol-dependent enzyme [Streptomyces albireticuli]PAU50435.1 mycothiol maleylpyruvate isomerase [Streptomyces albireticuli]
MTDHVHDLAAVREATDRLLSAVGKLDNAAVAEASRLPGWTRGHVLAHLARNADALVNVLAGRPMYAGAEVRDADIARGADRPLEVHLADLRDSAARFTDAAEAPGDPSRTVELRNGVTDTAARVPFRRLIEVGLHHVDLGIGYELTDLPAEFTARAIGYLAARYSGHRDVPAVTLTAEGGGQWRTGGTDGTPVSVTGTAPALLGWLSGRGAKGADLTTGAPLPALPPL